MNAAIAMCCGLCACTLAKAQVPAAFSVTNECSVAVDFRLTDDEMMEPKWRTLEPGVQVAVFGDTSPVDAFWCEVRAARRVISFGTVTYQPKDAAVVFTGDVCPA